MLAFVSACPWVPNTEAEILNILKLPYQTQCNGRITTVSQARIQTLHGSQTMSYTTYSVNGV